jgi:hypothetical protein
LEETVPVLVCGHDDGGVAGAQSATDVSAQLLEQKLILRIKLDAVLMVAVV